MSKDFVNSQQELIKAFLEGMAETSPIPIGLYQIKNGITEEVIPEAARAKYVEHCKLIQSFPGGKQKCERDQLARAEDALLSQDKVISECCWAGVHNERKPIKIDGNTKALLVYGGGQLEKQRNQNESLKKHKNAVKELNLSDEQATRLKSELQKIEPCSEKDFNQLQSIISKLERLVSILEEKQSERKYIAERSLHEIVTRLQAVIAEAENVITQVNDGDFELAKKTADAVLNTAESLDTVAQNLGNYLEAYQFRRYSLKYIVDQSIKLYEAEATRRGVQIVTQFQHPSDIEVSKNHLQYALNNLIHNAIKYSFRGGYNQQRNQKLKRYVEINGRHEKGFYQLSVANYGVGILSEEYEKVFEEGYKGNLTVNEYRTGSGMGLSFAKRIIDEHNGTVEVESIPLTKETTEEIQPYLTKFTIRLPYYQPR